MTQIHPAGFEPVRLTPKHKKELWKFDILCAAKSGAFQINNELLLDDFQQLVQVWSELPENIRQAIQLLIQTYIVLPTD
jgi:hypothetical protein